MIAKTSQVSLYPQRFGILQFLVVFLPGLVLGDVTLATVYCAEILVAVFATDTSLDAFGDPQELEGVFV